MPSKSQAENSERYAEVLTLEEAATYPRVSDDALRAMVSDDAIPAQKIGGEWRFLKRALNEWLRYGRRLYREFRRFPPPWMFEFLPMEEMLALEKRLLIGLATSEEKGDKRGSKKGVLKHVGIFRDDDDREERLAEARAKREAVRFQHAVTTQ